MDAMAAMLSRMIGMKPEELQAHFQNMQGLVLATAQKVSEIHESNTRIEQMLQEMKDERNGSTGDNGARPSRGRSANGGDSGHSSQ